MRTMLLVFAFAFGLAPGAHAAAKTSAYVYDMRVQVKGGATLDGRYPAADDPANARPDDAIENHYKASYSIDGRLRGVTLATGPIRGLPARGGTTGKAVVNGTWSNAGSKWVDPANGVSGPFQCGGGVRPGAPSGTTVVAYRRQAGAKHTFTLDVLAQELTDSGSCEGVNGAERGLIFANADAYVVKFSVSKRELGRKTIVKPISGPSSAFHWRAYDFTSGTFSLAWQGTVRFTRTHTMRLPRAR